MTPPGPDGVFSPPEDARPDRQSNDPHSEAITAALARLADAGLAARLLALDPAGFGGAALRARSGPARDAWMARVRAFLPDDIAWARLPPGLDPSRLEDAVDPAASLAAGRPVVAPGLFTRVAGGVVVAPMAERIDPGVAARLGAALDGPSPPCVIALDEGVDAEEGAPASLRDRLAFAPMLEGAPLSLVEEGLASLDETLPPREEDAEARARLADVTTPPEAVSVLTEAAAALGIGSLRAPVLALRVARAHAALCGRASVEAEDLSVAARLVLGPRARQAPAAPPPEAEAPDAQTPMPDEAPPDPAEPPTSEQRIDGDPPPDTDAPPSELPPPELVVAAALAALPPDVLARIAAGAAPRAAQARAARAGPERQGGGRGRPVGSRRGDPRRGDRLDLVATLTAGAPFQRLRSEERRRAGAAPKALDLRVDDLRVKRLKRRSESLAIFVVDASGSQAAARLAEAKGAVEALLAECYVRRDQVALVTFRGVTADIALPATRSLTRAKRLLAGVPGGGGTPLASGLDAAAALASQARRRGVSPLVVVMTDGRANIDRAGQPGREAAREDALAAARALRAEGVTGLVVDTGRRPGREATALAEALGATALALPRADPATLTGAVRRAQDQTAGAS